MDRINLTRLKSGEKGVVVEIQGGCGLTRRLQMLGIRIGVTVEKNSDQFLHGPVVVRVRGAQGGGGQVALGFGMAKRILVERKRQERTCAGG